MNSHEEGSKTTHWITKPYMKNIHPTLWMRQWSLILGSLVTLFGSIIILFYCDCYVLNNRQSGGKKRPLTHYNPNFHKKVPNSSAQKKNALGCVQLEAGSGIYCWLTHVSELSEKSAGALLQHKEMLRTIHVSLCAILPFLQLSHTNTKPSVPLLLISSSSRGGWLQRSTHWSQSI